jgi:hypothetical protein
VEQSRAFRPFPRQSFAVFFSNLLLVPEHFDHTLEKLFAHHIAKGNFDRAVAVEKELHLAGSRQRQLSEDRLGGLAPLIPECAAVVALVLVDAVKGLQVRDLLVDKRLLLLCKGIDNASGRARKKIVWCIQTPTGADSIAHTDARR